jgi:hypothetical protein
MLYSFNDAQAAGHRRTQYFEMFVNRAMYADGWWAASRANIPWEGSAVEKNPDSIPWELYNLDVDYSQATDLAKKNPAKLRELQDLWWTNAARYNVLPLDSRKIVRLSAELQGRPNPTSGRSQFVYYPGTEALPSGSAPNLLNKSFSITAEVEATGATTEGVVFAMGGGDGGYGIYVEKGQPVFAANFLGRNTVRAKGGEPLPSGKVKLRAEFAYDGGGMGKGGAMALFVNDKQVAQGRIEQTLPMTLGLGGTLDVGIDTGSPVDEAYIPPFRYNRNIEKVTIDLK